MEELANGNMELVRFFNEFKKLYNDPSLDIHTLLAVEVMIATRLDENNKKIDAELERLSKEVK